MADIISDTTLTNSMASLDVATQSSVADLHKMPKLWYKINVFVYDLRFFREDLHAQKRLDSIADASYIGLPYFTPSEAEILKATTIGNTTLAKTIEMTLHERLERRMKKRVESSDYRVCAAHDLAPIFEKSLGIDPKKLAKDKHFMHLASDKGLRLDGEVWTGRATENKLSASANHEKKKNKKRRR